MDIAELAARLEDQSWPPVHLWEPDFCGDMDLVIKSDGNWHYMGTPIGRKKLVRLFSTVLRLDADGEYYLVTPVEKLRIKVEDAPFLAVEMDVVKNESGQSRLVFRTNVDDIVAADSDHVIRVQVDPGTGEPRPYVHVRAGMEALIARSVYYQLVDIATATERDGVEVLLVESDGVKFELGTL